MNNIYWTNGTSRIISKREVRCVSHVLLLSNNYKIRKSELPHDITMIKALESHKRTDDFLSTSSESSST
jgi:hypothetical protein